MGYTGSDLEIEYFWYGGVHLKTFYKTLKISMENLAKCKKAYWQQNQMPNNEAKNGNLHKKNGLAGGKKD